MSDKPAKPPEMSGDPPHRLRAAERSIQLAADRNVFAAERTYGAWVRTGLAALASAIGTKTLLTDLLPDWAIRGTGGLLALFSAFCFGAAVWRALFPGARPPEPDVRQIPWKVLALINITLMVVAAVALVSIVFAPAQGQP